jgi:ribonucleoside-diphosphate reductase alpha chain
MDDLVDLELEAVDTIISKIESDPESEAVKHAELALWRKIKDAASKGRRTGLGITAMGDALAALNIRYGSQESVDRTEEIYKVLEVNAYRSSVRMAAERGAFPIFSHKLEAEHEFIQKVISADPELRADYLKHGRRNIALTTTFPVSPRRPAASSPRSSCPILVARRSLLPM